MKKQICFILFTALLLNLFAVFPALSLEADTPGYDNTQKSALEFEETVPDIMTLNGYDDMDYEIRPEITQDSVFGISTAAGLSLLSDLTNNSRYKTKFRAAKYLLTADIDMSKETSFKPIANYTSANAMTKSIPAGFGGIFDGQGHKIDGLQIKGTSSTARWVALFGALKESATVKNLVFGDGCSFSYEGNQTNTCTAALAGRMVEGAAVTNIYSMANVAGGYYSGGIIARLDPADRNGSSSVINRVSQITVTGDTKGKAFVGGVIGAVFGNLDFSLCRQTGNVEGESENACVGGLIGKVGEAFGYENVSVESTKLQTRVIVRDSVNLGNFFGGSESGGVIGLVEETNEKNMTLELQNCTNEGVCEEKKQRALVGACDTVNQAVVTDCEERSAGVRLHGVQFKGGDTEETFSVRFVGSVGTLDYSELGFNIILDYGEKHYEIQRSCSTVFKKLSTGENQSSPVETLRGEDGYLFALIIENIPADVGEINFSVTPYAVDSESGETITGIGGNLLCRNGVPVPAWE